jgi:hypothetical protein
MTNSNNMAAPHSIWGKLTESDIHIHKPGYFPAVAYHIYCDLRLVQSAEDSENDATVYSTVAAIERFVHLGEEAARLRGLVLLELQGTVLHFLKVGEPTVQNTDDVIDFVFDFTKGAYEDLRPKLADKWNGFASAFDHGNCLIINHSSQFTKSTVSLGPAANSPAKVLSDKSTSPSGSVTVPTRLVPHHNPDRRKSWVSIPLNTRSTSPSQNNISLSEAFSRLPQILRKSDARIENFSFRSDGQHSPLTPGMPQRMNGAFVRFDLDGFTKLVEEAFQKGQDQVRKLAESFNAVMDYAEKIANAHSPSLMLPWAGDCAGFILPGTFGIAKRYPRWLGLCFDWLASEFNSVRTPMLDLQGTSWAAGASEKPTETLIVSTIEVQNRLFTFAFGTNRITAQCAQESAKGGELAITPDDYNELSVAVKKLFVQKNEEGFWVATEPSEQGLRRTAIQTGVTASASQSGSLAASSIPPIRPYFSQK